ncbi:DEAD/DEAH box helicase, partial [Cribrihabitans sp. XS_ASV171]
HVEAKTDQEEDKSTRKPRGRKSEGGKPRREDRDKAVVGMGDHLPSFIAKSFEERRAS